MLVGAGETGTIQWELLFYGNTHQRVYDIRMAAKKKDVKAKENQARKPVAAKATPSNSGMSLAEFKSKYKPSGRTSASVGQPGGAKNVPVGTGSAYTGPKVTGAKTPVSNTSSRSLRGMQGQIGFAPENWKKAAVDVVTIAASGPARGIQSVASSIGSKAGSKVGTETFVGSMAKASEGISGASIGGKVYRTVTPEGPNLASTRIGSPAQVAARAKGLYKRAENIASESAQIAGSTTAKLVKDFVTKTATTAVKGASVIGQKTTNRKKIVKK